MSRQQVSHLHLSSAGTHRLSATSHPHAVDAMRRNARRARDMLLRSNWHNIRLKDNQSRSG
jgi:hypothetical protein